MGRSAVFLAGNTLAAALVAPVVLAAGFVLAVEGIATGRAFGLLVLVDRFLPASAELGAAALGLVVLSSLGLLVFGCLRLSWLFPALLLLSGGLAEFQVLGTAGWWQNGDSWIPALGAAGLALSAVQLLRAT